MTVSQAHRSPNCERRDTKIGRNEARGSLYTGAAMFPRLHTPFDGGRREAWFVSMLAVLLVLLRSVVFLVWEHIDFDSDQAIVGLMAKHLSEFRTFPLFFYGQNYMLGVQAWFTAPFFWIARPSVALLKTPLVILNATAAVLLIRTISGQLGVRPAVAFVAALPFIAPTPPVAGSYLQTLGSSGIEPLIYIVLLWYLRSRPVAFGALLAVGFLHREFTMYSMPENSTTRPPTSLLLSLIFSTISG